jgi:hypothetical protein
MMRVAQTNLQLYNQLRERGDSLDDLRIVHGAYELLCSLYPGYFQADGKPFVCHGVGVASIVAELGRPANVIAAALVHNVYGNADFGDGGGPGRSEERRRVVREAVGPEVEELVYRFADLRITPSTIDGFLADLPQRDERDRALLLVDLCDHLEKYVDLGVLYFGQSDWIVDGTDHIAPKLTAMANALGHPRLAEMLSKALADAEAADEAPAELRPPETQRYLKLIVPRSCEPRDTKPMVWRVRDKVRIRTRLRALRG